MKSVIICEGNDDLTLIQYFLQKAHGWNYIKKSEINLYSQTLDKFNNAKDIKWLRYGDNNFLAIISSGGVQKIKDMVSAILDVNIIGTGPAYDRMVIVTDRDEVDTEETFLFEQVNKFNEFNISFEFEIKNNKWQHANYITSIGDSKEIDFLPLIIPFEEEGALETFLLNSIKNESLANDVDKVDKIVIEQCEEFIDRIDTKGKYLTKRRHIIKAKFHTYFVVAAPKEAFNRRDSILQGVPWEEYQSIQSSFKELEKLKME